MSDDEVCDELRARHAAELHQEEQRQEIEEIAQQENIHINHIVLSTALIYS